MKLEPSMIEAHLALEKLYTNQEQMTKALYHLSKAVEIDPEDATPHYRLSVLYRKLGRTGEAEKEMQLFEKTKSKDKTVTKEKTKIETGTTHPATASSTRWNARSARVFSCRFRDLISFGSLPQPPLTDHRRSSIVTYRFTSRFFPSGPHLSARQW